MRFIGTFVVPLALEWTITGKFAGVTGTGKMKGSLTGAPFVFSGRYQS
jgi:hypothetical protein